VRFPQLKVTYIAALIAIVAGSAILYPKTSSADVISILASVFENKDVKKIKEIEPVTNRNAQTMSLLESPLSPNQPVSTAESRKKYKALVALVDDKALTNENSPVSDKVVSLESEVVASDRISLYTVRDGDTYEQIARMYNVNVNTILWANDLKKGAVLKPDQVLVILPISGLKYIVKKGDTLKSIAKTYKGDADEIANFNNLNTEVALAIGDEIIIPDIEGNLTVLVETKQPTKTKKDAKVFVKNDSNIPRNDSTGFFVKPVVGGVRTQGLHGHNGIDFAHSYGSPIIAAASGKVVVSKTGGWGGGYGNYVVLQHQNGSQTLYAHLSEVLVKVGQQVQQSEQIGKMGSTGDSTGVHLHFEVRGGKNPF
jgi:LysM repeat protein